MAAALFSPIRIGALELPNRIAVAPMCQYSAVEGSVTDWHLYQWMSYATSGAGMITMEMTNVEKRGRITHACVGLFSDHNEHAMARALLAAREVAVAGAKFGVQIAHAGRKASCQLPWEGGGPLGEGQSPWSTVSASALPFAEGWHVPSALSDGEIEAMIDLYADAARRARRAGFDFIEVHGAHGYLIDQFASPLSNIRTDSWGGSRENRERFGVEVLRRIRAAVPGMMVGIRISVTDWADGGKTVEDGLSFARRLCEAGADYICCSSGGNSSKQSIPTGPGYQVHLAEAVRKVVNIPVRAVGLITEPAQAEAILREKRADVVAVGRAILADPRWPWRAAATLGEPIQSVPQLARSFTTLTHWVKEREALPG